MIARFVLTMMFWALSRDCNIREISTIGDSAKNKGHQVNGELDVGKGDAGDAVEPESEREDRLCRATVRMSSTYLGSWYSQWWTKMQWDRKNCNMVNFYSILSEDCELKWIIKESLAHNANEYLLPTLPSRPSGEHIPKMYSFQSTVDLGIHVPNKLSRHVFVFWKSCSASASCWYSIASLSRSFKRFQSSLPRFKFPSF